MKPGFARFFVLLLLFQAVSACSGGSSSAVRQGTATAVVTSTGPLPPPDSTSAFSTYTGVSDYRLGPQDLIDISVFQVSELTKTVRVNSLGQISLPLVGTLQVGGLTVQETESFIAKSLAEKFLQNPQVTVFIKEYSSQRVTLEGEIGKSGIYPLTGRTTLLQCIAMGGGFKPLADLRGVVIFRQVDGKKMAAVFDIKAIRSGNAEDPLVYGNDIIVVDQSGSKSAMAGLIKSIRDFSVFRIIF